LHVGGIGGGGVQTGVYHPLADNGVDSGDKARPAASGGQDSVQQVAGGGLAIGAGHAHNGELAGRKAMPGGRKVGQGFPAVGDDGEGHPAFQLFQFPFRHHSDGAVGQSLRDIIVPVYRHATIGDEQAARRHLARVAGNSLDGYISSAQYPGVGKSSQKVG